MGFASCHMQMFSYQPSTDRPWAPPSLPWGPNGIWAKHLNIQLHTLKMSKICGTQHPHLQYAFVTWHSTTQPTSYLLPPLYMVASCNIVHFFNIQALNMFVHSLTPQWSCTALQHRNTKTVHLARHCTFQILLPLPQVHFWLPDPCYWKI
jgi:hypothetical protein